MSINNLIEIIKHALDDYKALDVVILDITELTDIADTMVICSGTSKRHVQSMADHVAFQAKNAGYTIIGIEGQTHGEWILIDLGDAIVHVMLPTQREFYSLEKLWSTAKELRQKP